jgi:mxaL protein
MKLQKPARRDKAGFQLRWILASLAGVLFILAYTPKHPLKVLASQWQAFQLRRRSQSASIIKT